MFGYKYINSGKFENGVLLNKTLLALQPLTNKLIGNHILPENM